MVSQTRPCFLAKADLGIFLAGMAVGGTQYGREAIVGGADDWSFTVDELLRVTGGKPILKRTPHVFRGNQATAGFIVDTTVGLDTTAGFDGVGGPLSPEGEGLEWPEGPMSTVHFTFRGQE